MVLKNNKKVFVKHLILFALLLFVVSCNNKKELKTNNSLAIADYIETKKNKKPNVIILIADDISRDDFGCYGHKVIKTPNIDNLAKNGIKFNNAVLTTSSCSPSRVSIITGRYPHNTGAPELHSPLPENQVLFPELLKQNGYYTAQSGKWHFGSSPAKPTGVALRAFHITGGSSIDGGGESGSEKWVEVLQNRPKNKPFFMWFAAHDAHRKWDNDTNIKYKPEEVVVLPYLVDNKKTREDLVSYYQEVSRFDQNVGKVVEELKAQGIFENTIIIVMADNGRPFPRDKTRLYDSGILTPFIISYPNLINNTNATSTSLVSVIDIAPTLMELTNTKPSEKFQGKSFAEILNNPTKEIRKYAFTEHNWHDYQAYERSIRTKEFIYIENSLPQLTNIGAIDVMGGGAGQSLFEGMESNSLNKVQKEIFLKPQASSALFERANDYYQFNNLINNPKYDSIKNSLKQTLKDWMITTRDTKPKELTPDWYDRKTLEATKNKGIRGVMPGINK